MRIYLDHNAGSPLRDCAREAMFRCLDECGHGNPASVHRSGQRARRILEDARERVASLIGAPARAIVFTSGGTESNNLAILGAARGQGGTRRKIVTSSIEHSSVLAPLAHLEAEGFEVVRIAPDHEGRLASERVAEAIDGETALVTLALANAEVGTVQLIPAIAQAAVRAGARFHVDAAQAVGRMAVDAEELGCDLLTLSAHKLGGPVGIGALYLRDPVAISQQILGGPQELGVRAGTPNLIGAMGFGAAATNVASVLEDEMIRVANLSATLLESLNEKIPGLRLNGPLDGRIRNTLNLSFPGVLGESLLIALDLEGIEVSMGSACAAGAVEPSHVLMAMGRSAAQARSSLRLSLGWSTSAAEIARAGEIIPKVWRRVAAAEPAAAEARA
jgi:cysteine desulfurase